MKIGINVSFLAKPMTGIGQVTKEFLKTLSEHPEFSKHQWYFYTDGPLTPTDKPLTHPANCTWREVKTWWSRQDIPHQYLFERWSLPRAVAQDTLEVFLSLYQSTTVLPKPMRHVMLVHDLVPKLFPEYQNKWTSRLYYRFILKGIRQATHILTPSQATKTDIVQELGVEDSQITAIPLGIDQRFFERFEREVLEERLKTYDLIPGYLYHGGGLEIRKNTEAVLRAYHRLIQANISNLPPLVISGKIHATTNPLATPVERLVKELHLEDRVKLLGLVPEEDLPYLYQGATVFLFPSRYEGFGLPVLEALASGTPVITTAAGSLKELVSDEEALIIRDLSQVEENLTIHIQSLLEQPTLGKRFKEAGLAKATQYRWETFTEKVQQVLLQ